jgi:hypothetical protein
MDSGLCGGTGMTVKEMLELAYFDGFMASGEGYNAEFPFWQKGTDPEDDAHWLSRRDLFVKTIMEDAGFEE